MEEVPQPSPEPYTVDDRVQIYIGPADPDSQYHGTECEVVELYSDDLDSETGRNLDSYSYTLRSLETGEELPIQFRHRDLIPSLKEIE